MQTNINPRETEFNMSAKTLERIHSNFLMVALARSNKNFDGVNDFLTNNYMEVFVYLPEMPEVFREKLKYIRAEIKKYLAQVYHFSDLFKFDRDSNTQNAIRIATSKLWDSLELFEQHIRLICKKKNLMMPEKASASEAVYEES